MIDIFAYAIGLVIGIALKYVLVIVAFAILGFVCQGVVKCYKTITSYKITKKEATV